MVAEQTNDPSLKNGVLDWFGAICPPKAVIETVCLGVDADQSNPTAEFLSFQESGRPTPTLEHNDNGNIQTETPNFALTKSPLPFQINTLLAIARVR